MFRLDAELRVYLHRDAIDFRAGINSLVLLVEQSLQLDPFAREIFAFRNRKRNRVELVAWTNMTSRNCRRPLRPISENWRRATDN